jgi:hypothetical protein
LSEGLNFAVTAALTDIEGSSGMRRVTITDCCARRDPLITVSVIWTVDGPELIEVAFTKTTAPLWSGRIATGHTGLNTGRVFKQVHSNVSEDRMPPTVSSSRLRDPSRIMPLLSSRRNDRSSGPFITATTFPGGIYTFTELEELTPLSAEVTVATKVYSCCDGSE